eukprot:scaffold10323_cov163-Skeletonema_dohrnii-CCMP3373.AAC.3
MCYTTAMIMSSSSLFHNDDNHRTADHRPPLQIIGLSAAKSLPSCSCSPRSLTLQINLSGTCPADITNIDRDNQFCFVSLIGSNSGSSSSSSSSALNILDAGGSDLQPPSDPIPMSITSILYYELSESLEVINQETVTVSDNNPVAVTLMSISANLDPNKFLSEQHQLVVSSAVLFIEGTNAAGTRVKNTVSWKYDLQQCNMVPMAIGNTLGWVNLIDLELAKPEFCPAVATTIDPTSTEMATTAAAMTTTTNASNGGWEPTYAPTMNPVYPTYSPTEDQTEEPSKSPTFYPTYSPTAGTGLVDNSEGKPTLSGHSSGWAADGWTPPETHLLGGSQTNIGTTTTPATEASSSTNGTESSSTTVSGASTSEYSSTAAEEVTTATIAATTTSTTTIISTSTTAIATSTTSEATRPPKTTTTTTKATRPPKTTTTTTKQQDRPSRALKH